MHLQLLYEGDVFDASEEYLQDYICRFARLQFIIGKKLFMSLVFS